MMIVQPSLGIIRNVVSSWDFRSRRPHVSHTYSYHISISIIRAAIHFKPMTSTAFLPKASRAWRIDVTTSWVISRLIFPSTACLPQHLPLFFKIFLCLFVIIFSCIGVTMPGHSIVLVMYNYHGIILSPLQCGYQIITKELKQ